MDSPHAAHAFSFAVDAVKVAKLKAGLKQAAVFCKLRHLIVDGQDKDGTSIVRISVSGEASWVTTFGEMIELVTEHFE